MGTGFTPRGTPQVKLNHTNCFQPDDFFYIHHDHMLLIHPDGGFEFYAILSVDFPTSLQLKESLMDIMDDLADLQLPSRIQTLSEIRL